MNILRYTLLVCVLFYGTISPAQSKEETIVKIWDNYTKINEVAARDGKDSLKYMMDSLLVKLEEDVVRISSEMDRNEKVGMQFLRISAAQNAAVYAFSQNKTEEWIKYIRPKYKDMLDFYPKEAGKFWVKFMLYNIGKDKIRDAQHNLLSVLFNHSTRTTDEQFKLDISKRLLNEPTSSIYNKAVSCMLLTSTYFEQKDTATAFLYGKKLMLIYAELNVENKSKFYKNDGLFKNGFPNMFYAGLKQENTVETETKENVDKYVKLADGKHPELCFFLNSYKVTRGWIIDKETINDLYAEAKKQGHWEVQRDLEKYLNDK